MRHWGKRILSAIVVAILLISFCLTVYQSDKKQSVENLTTEDYLEDFDYMCKVIEEEYPYLSVLQERGVNYNALKTSTRNEIETSVSTLDDFYNCIHEMLGVQMKYVAHIDVFSTDYYDYSKAYLDNSAYGSYWESLMNDPQTASAYEILGCGTTTDSASTDIASEEVAYRYEEDIKAIVFRIPSFLYSECNIDPAFIEASLQEYADRGIENIVFDITGNGGGSSHMWQEGIVPYFGGQYHVSKCIYGRDTEYVRASLNGQDVFEPIPDNIEVPDFVHTLGFTHAWNLEYDLDYGLETYPDAKRWVLIDSGCYSTADSFALFCRQTGWATLVGYTTSGDGGGLSVMRIKLPHTGLLFQFSATTEDNGSGQPNSLYGTKPNYPAKSGESPFMALKRILQNSK